MKDFKYMGKTQEEDFYYEWWLLELLGINFSYTIEDGIKHTYEINDNEVSEDKFLKILEAVKDESKN